MTSSTAPSVSRNNTFDASRLYKSVRFQQGRPVLDTELNDLQDITIESISSILRENARFSGLETSPFEWAIVPLGLNADSALNSSNFAVTMGRLPTALGMVDNTTQFADIADIRVPYDHIGATANGYTTGLPLNYLFKGAITSISDIGSSTATFADANKMFKTEHLLVERSSDFDFTASVPDLSFNVSTGNCRILFTTGAYADTVYTLVAFTGSNLTIQATNLSALAVGDEYYILPPNELAITDSLVNSALPYNTLPGASANPIHIAFVQTFEDDVSSEEDPDLLLAQVGMETTHRTQVRWCVRIARLSGNAVRNYSSFFIPTAENDKITAFKGASEIRSILSDIILTDEYSVSGDRIGGTSPRYLSSSINGVPTYDRDSLILGSGVTESDLLWSTALSEEPRSLSGSLPSIVMSKMGDSGVFDWSTIKAYLLAHLFLDTQNIDQMSDASVLGMFTRASKPVSRVWFESGAPTSTALSYPENSTTGITYNARVWFNDVSVAEGSTELNSMWFGDSRTSGTSSDSGVAFTAPTTVRAPATFITPPRVYLRQSEITTEISRARTLLYSAPMNEAIAPLQRIYAPTHRQTLVVREVATGTPAVDSYYGSAALRLPLLHQVVFDSVDARLNALDIAVSNMLGRSGVSYVSERYLSGRPYDSTRLSTWSLPHSANKLLTNGHITGVAQAGTPSERSATNAMTSYKKFTEYEDSTFSVGTMDFVDPLSQTTRPTVGASIDQRNMRDGFAFYKTREAYNGINTILATDTENGWTRNKSTGVTRDWHEGIASAQAFKDSFNFRKLAIKTTAHAEGDLFTINQPVWFTLKQRDAVELYYTQNSGVKNSAFFASFFSGLADRLSSALPSFSAAVRAHLSNPESNGPMGIDSVGGLAFTPEMGVGTASVPSIYRGKTATNSTLLPFLDQISGSASIARFDYANGDINNTSATPYASSADIDPAKMIDPERGGWGRRIVDTSASTLNDVSPDLDSNRCTSLRLRYHVGDFYPGDLDARGIPSNLLVDSINLFVRVEPLPLVHWMTMPKHQHSILEGSMDMSEAIATLLDLSNGRGIPDHLFTLSKSSLSKTGDNPAINFIGAEGLRGTLVPNSALDIDALLKPATPTNTPVSSDFLESLINSDFNQALESASINAPVLNDTGSFINGRITGNTTTGGGTLLSVSFVDFRSTMFSEIDNAGTRSANYFNRFFSSQSLAILKPYFNAYFNGSETVEAMESNGLTATEYKTLTVALIEMYRSVQNLALTQSSANKRDAWGRYNLDGIASVSSTGSVSGTSITEGFITAPNENPVSFTAPIVSPWLSKIQTAISAYPAMSGYRAESSAVDSAMPTLGVITPADVNTLVNARSEASYALKFKALFEATKARVGSIDPVGVAIPNAAQPFVHWYHPNMGALASNASTSKLQTYAEASPGGVNLNVGYQAYPAWSRETMIYTGIVPFNDRAPQRLQQLMSAETITGYNYTSGANEAGFTEGTRESGDTDLRDNLLDFLTNANEATTSAELMQQLYKGLFDYEFTPAANRSNAHTAGWLAGVGSGVSIDDTNNTTNYVPYFSHSTGLLGFGALTSSIAGSSGSSTVEAELSLVGMTPTDARYDAWANWFPYLPSYTHSIGQVALDRTADVSRTRTIRERLTSSVFAERTRPVYLPASAVVFNNTRDYLRTGTDGLENTVSDVPAYAAGASGTPASFPAGGSHLQANIGYNPLINSITSASLFTTESAWKQAADVALSPVSAINTQYYDVLSQAASNTTAASQISSTDVTGVDTSFARDAFNGAALRSGINTHTLAWLNLYTKTYNRTYGHESLHPYSFLDEFDDKPVWHIDFANGKGVVSGKGPDKDTDTLYMGDMGTNIYVTKRSTFIDPLCLGVGAMRQSGKLVHDSDNDALRMTDMVFRDIFDLCEYERVSFNAINANTNPIPSGVLRASAAWSKMGMQSKLLLNSSLRVLHTRPGGATRTDGAEVNYGAMGTPAKSLTEMFLAIDPITNKLKQLPRSAITKSSHKPFIQLEALANPVSVTEEDSHPNAAWIHPLKPMVLTDMSGVSLSGQANTRNFLSGTVSAGDAYDVIDATTPEKQSALLGDVFASDPFDTAWDQQKATTGSVNKHPIIAPTAKNSGVEYELLSSLARMHATKDKLNLGVTINNNSAYPLDSMIPTPNELTLPGDHEIVFVLYTGDYGQSMSQDVHQGINPPVAGCHIKATIEINRPSERRDSNMSASNTLARGLHYGVTSAHNAPIGADSPQGLATYTVAGGRATTDLTVYNAKTGVVIP